MSCLLVSADLPERALRYLLSSVIPVLHGFPLATLLINLAGSFLIGALSETAAVYAVNDRLLLFLKVGVCGGFTTFSTFSLETVNLFECGKYGLGVIYAIVSVLLCVAGVFLGKLAVRSVIK